MRLKDQVGIVTGGSKGIGRAYVQGLAQEGAQVIVADIADGTSIVEETRRAQGKARYIRTDVSGASSVRDLVADVLRREGRIDFLVNNAGIPGRFARKPIEEVTVEEWDRIFAVNARGMFLASQAVIPHMKGRRAGKIVNIASNTPFQGTPGMIPYVASKSTVIGFTRALAREVGDFGIAVNGLAPDYIPLEEDLVKVPAYAQAIVASRCFKRQMVPEDLVGTLIYLLSSDSDFLTGQTLVVNGGSYLH